MAISASLIQCLNDISIEKSPMPMLAWVVHIDSNHSPPGTLARVTATMAQTSSSMPPVDSLWKNVLKMWRISLLR